MIDTKRLIEPGGLDRAASLQDEKGRLFLRYCRGRLRSLWVRQILTVVGSTILGLIVSPLGGIASIAVILSGDWIDCANLRSLLKRADTRQLQERDYRSATVSAAFQAFTTAICLGLLVWYSDSVESDFAAAAFLCSAGINSGVTAPFHWASSMARIVVFSSTFIFVFFRSAALLINGDVTLLIWANLAVGMFVLAYTALGFIAFVRTNFARRLQYEAAILAEQGRLEASRALLAEKERQARRLALVAENANDSVIITNPEGRIVWVNETFTRISGFNLQEICDRLPADLLVCPETDADTLARLIEAQEHRQPIRTEILRQCKSGAQVWMETSQTPIFDPDGSFTMTIAVEREITEMKKREAELARARAEAEEAARAKSNFLATMSHEIRTPMNGVIGMAQLLAETRLEGEQRRYVEIIVDCCSALLTIINDILDLSRLQSGKPTMLSQRFDVHEGLRGVVDLLSPMGNAKSISVRLQEPDEPVPALLGDPGRVRQVLMNLIGNAIKFTEKGGVSVSVTHRPQDADRHRVEIAIQDTGIGIPPERLETIFESFTQADGNVSRRFGGTGLGLTISRVLAREMGGEIELSSIAGEGSVFTLSLCLPLAPERRDRPPRSRRKPRSDARRAKLPHAEAKTLDGAVGSDSPVRRILVADDNVTNRLLLDKILTAPERELYFAAEGHEAVRLYREKSPHLILMDLSMPGMDGHEATRLIRAEEAEGTAHCPIIALTANAMEDARHACLQGGFDDFLTKPLSKPELLACVNRHLRAVERQAKQRRANGL